MANLFVKGKKEPKPPKQAHEKHQQKHMPKHQN